MTYYRVRPPALLSGMIDYFTYWEGGEPSQERMSVMASRAMSIQINLHDTTLRWYGGGETHVLKGVTLAGAQSRHFGIDAHQPRIVRVLFKPGGAWPFFRPPPSEFSGTHVSLEDIWGACAARLQMQLAEAPTVATLFGTLGDFLVSIAPRELSNRPAISLALSLSESSPAIRASELARRAELSAKRFIRIFTEEVGLTPKLYLRITRFERLLKEVFPAPRVDWADAAVRHGYFDQPHLIRDFRDFAGMTPTDYLARRGPADHAARA